MGDVLPSELRSSGALALMLHHTAIAEAWGASTGSPIQVGSRMGAPSRETLQISPSYIAANAAAIHEEHSSEEEEGEPVHTARILFAFDPENEDEVVVKVGESVQVWPLGYPFPEHRCEEGALPLLCLATV